MKKRIVLAEGERTGHAHVLTGSATKKDAELEVLEESELTHEEHNALTIDPDQYDLGTVQEYDHFAEEARNVAD